MSEALLRKGGWAPSRQVDQSEVDKVVSWWNSIGIEANEQALRVIRSLWGLRIQAVRGEKPVFRPETIIFAMPLDAFGAPTLPIADDIIELLVEDGFAGPSIPAPVAHLDVNHWQVVCAVNADGRCFAVLSEANLWMEFDCLDTMICSIVMGKAGYRRKRGLFDSFPDEP
ncbi:MAG TPA: hypothetical protein PK095_15090 [Myxococcota bacterium]|nr:hypothetical protein [Myxococcota bacterium]